MTLGEGGGSGPSGYVRSDEEIGGGVLREERGEMKQRVKKRVCEGRRV
jgi:hypothetical protein